jgi:ABC-type transport system involved in multi-copper enzyme maturation permease subunit
MLTKTFKVPKHFGSLCAPAKIYTVLALISCIVYVIAMLNADSNLQQYENHSSLHGYTAVGLLCKVVFSVLWVILLNYICKTFKNGNTISWVILLLPLFLFLFALLLMLFVVSQTCLINQSLLRKQTSFETKQHSYETHYNDFMNQPPQTKEVVSEYGYDVQGSTL